MLYYVDLPEQCYVLSIGRAGESVDKVTWTLISATAEQAKSLGIEAGEVDSDKLELALTAKETGVLPKLADPRRASQTTDQLAVLWQMLVPEADRKALTDGTYKSVVIVNCSSLGSLPFEALVTAKESETEYLLDSGPPVLYAPSATILMNLAEQKATAVATARQPILTVGDPAYTSGKISRLPYTATESHWVKEAYTKHGQATTQLLNAQATEGNVRSQIAGAPRHSSGLPRLGGRVIRQPVWLADPCSRPNWKWRQRRRLSHARRNLLARPAGLRTGDS